MRKLVLSLFVLSLSSMLQAETVGWVNRVWRSSFTNTANNRVSITSIPAIASEVCIGTSAPNAYVVLFDTVNFNINTSTRVFFRADTVNSSGCQQVPNQKFINGLAYTTSDPGLFVTIFWDWIVKPTYTTPHDGN